MENEVYRIIDVNYNRMREALRVIEDILRFMLKNNELTEEARSIRHSLCEYVKCDFIKYRNVDEDFGKAASFDTYTYNNYKDVFIRNLSRAEESARVLEEFFKLIDSNISVKIKELRFRLYSLEKNAIERIY